MKCPACRSGSLRVVRTFQANHSKTQKCACSKCGKGFTTVTVVVGSSKRYGRGAYALAMRLRRMKHAPTLSPNL